MFKYYKDNNGNLFGFNADGSQDNYIPSELISITNEEADVLREEIKKKITAKFQTLQIK